MELHCKIFNNVLSRVLLLIKLVCLFNVIFCGFAAIRLVHHNFLLCLVFLDGFLICGVMYVTMFQLASKVTDKVEGLKQLIRTKYTELPVKGMSREFDKVLWSIPELVMTVGSFHRVERESVLNFVDFVTNQIVSLLVMF